MPRSVSVVAAKFMANPGLVIDSTGATVCVPVGAPDASSGHSHSSPKADSEISFQVPLDRDTHVPAIIAALSPVSPHKNDGALPSAGIAVMQMPSENATRVFGVSVASHATPDSGGAGGVGGATGGVLDVLAGGGG